MKKLTKEEIKKQLKGVEKELVVAFVARCAVRVFPLLANEDENTFLEFWKKEKRSKYLFSVFHACNISLCFRFATTTTYTTHAYVAHDAAADAADAAYAAYAADAYVAHAVAAAAAAAATAATAAYAAYADADADAYAYADADAYAYAAYDVAVHATIAFELQQIRSDIVLDEYFCQPLWDSPSDEITAFNQHFIACLHKYGHGFDYWADWFEDRLNGKKLDKNLIERNVNIPAEIIDQGVEKTNAYLKSIASIRQEVSISEAIMAHADTSLIPLNRVRAIFIGYGAAGKTSLIRVLNGKTVVAEQEEMTPGIEISDWKVPNSDITADFWDFGGQVMAHATHQFFLRERCLYVLLLDGRTEINANQQAQYWLEHVKAFGNNAQVMIVGNKADLTEVNIDLFTLKKKYSNIIDFYSLSCTKSTEKKYKLKLEQFREDFVEQLQNVGTHQVMFPESYFRVLQELQKVSLKQTFLAKTGYEKICRDHNIPTKGALNRAWLLDLFDKLGIIIHFPAIPTLGSYLLNPQWLTYGVYTILYSDRIKEKKGCLTEQDIIDVLRKKKDVRGVIVNTHSYSSKNCDFIIKAMKEFHLCYSIKNKHNTFILPGHLPSERPKELSFEKRFSLAFEFHFKGFLPPHVITESIVNRHEDIVEIVEKQMVWKQGVCLKNVAFEAKALLEADYHERSLSLWVQGKRAGDYFLILRDIVMETLKRMPELEYDEWMFLPEDTLGRRPKARFRQLLALEEAGQSYIDETGTYDVADFLSKIPKNKEGKSIVTHTINIGGNANNLAINSSNTTQTSSVSTNKNTDLFVQMIEGLKKDAGLSPEEVEELTDEVNFLRKELAKKKPRKGIVTNIVDTLEKIESISNVVSELWDSVKGVFEPSE